jgi:hypothetical protein
MWQRALSLLKDVRRELPQSGSCLDNNCPVRIEREPLHVLHVDDHVPREAVSSVGMSP